MMSDQTKPTQSASTNSIPEESGQYLQSSIRRRRLSRSQSLKKPQVKSRSQSIGGAPPPNRLSFSYSLEAGQSERKDIPDRRPSLANINNTFFSLISISSQVWNNDILRYNIKSIKIVVQVAQIAVTDLLTSPLGLGNIDDPNDIIDHLVADLKEAMLAE